MKTGIVIAMDKEFQRVRDLLADVRDEKTATLTFTTGRIGNNEVVLTQCGVGKVNAAIGATELINRYKPEAVVSTGVAGGADTSLNVADVVVSAETCYHDVYCGEELAYGQVMGSPARFTCDASLVEKALSLDCGTTIKAGLTVTGDWFVDSREKMHSIVDRFPEAMAVDMESAAIAHVCEKYGVPFVSFRIISDIPLKDHKAQQYFDFWTHISDSSFAVTRAFLERL